MASGFALVGAGMGIVTQVELVSRYDLIAVAMVCIGGGLSIAMVAATTSIMAATPESKAGIGSAVNDAASELGGAVGIAVLGSVANAGYRANLDVTDLALRADAADTASQSVGAAYGVAERLGPTDASLLTARAATAFSEAFNQASLVGALIAAAAAVPLYWVHATQRRSSRGADRHDLDVD